MVKPISAGEEICSCGSKLRESRSSIKEDPLNVDGRSFIEARRMAPTRIRRVCDATRLASLRLASPVPLSHSQYTVRFCQRDRWRRWWKEYSRTRIHRISADCEIYPIYPKSDIYEEISIVLYYGDRKFYPIYPSSTVSYNGYVLADRRSFADPTVSSRDLSGPYHTPSRWITPGTRDFLRSIVPPGVTWQRPANHQTPPPLLLTEMGGWLAANGKRVWPSFPDCLALINWKKEKTTAESAKLSSKLSFTFLTDQQYFCLDFLKNRPLKGLT